MQASPFAASQLQSDTSELNFAANATQQAASTQATPQSNPSAFQSFPAHSATHLSPVTAATATTATQQNPFQASSKFDSHPYDGPINFKALFWVDRGPNIWLMQTTIAVICLFEALLMQYLTYKVSNEPTSQLAPNLNQRPTEQLTARAHRIVYFRSFRSTSY